MDRSHEDVALKQTRKDRSSTTAKEIRRIFLDHDLEIDERMRRGLAVLGDKIIQDVEEQFAHVSEAQADGAASQYAEAEVARLLRMLEKRRDLLDQMEAVLSDA